MPRKRYKPEEIVAKLRQVDVLVSQGQSMGDAIRQIGVSEVTFYRWRQEFGGLKTDQVKRLKDLELENSRLRKAVSDLTRSVSSRPRGTLRCVERCCPSAAQARRSETCSCARTCSMQARRRAGLRSFPERPPAE